MSSCLQLGSHHSLIAPLSRQNDVTKNKLQKYPIKCKWFFWSTCLWLYFYFLMRNLLLIQNSRKQFSTQDDLADWQVLLILFTWEGVVSKLMIRSHIKLIKYTSPPVIACHHFFKTVLYFIRINYFDAQESFDEGIWSEQARSSWNVTLCGWRLGSILCKVRDQ